MMRRLILIPIYCGVIALLCAVIPAPAIKAQSSIGQQALLISQKISSGGGFSPAFVSGAGTNSSSGTTCAVTITGVASRFLVFTDAINSATLTDGTPTDGTNTWTAVRGPDDGSSGGTAIRSYSWRAANSVVGSLTVTVTRSAGGFSNCQLEQFSGMGTNPTTVTGSFASMASTTAYSSGNATVTAADVRMGYGGTMNANSTITAGTNFTTPASTAGTITGGGSSLNFEYDLNAAGGSQAATMTLNTAQVGGMAQIIFTPHN